MNRFVRQAHIDHAIESLNAHRAGALTSADGRYSGYNVGGYFQVIQHTASGQRVVLSAKTRRELLDLIEAYTQGVRDTRSELGNK